MILELDELDQEECPTCGGVGYLGVTAGEDCDPCPNCNPSAGLFVVLTPAQRRKEFAEYADLN